MLPGLLVGLGLGLARFPRRVRRLRRPFRRAVTSGRQLAWDVRSSAATGAANGCFLQRRDRCHSGLGISYPHMSEGVHCKARPLEKMLRCPAVAAPVCTAQTNGILSAVLVAFVVLMTACAALPSPKDRVETT